MNTSIFLAKVMGLYFVITSLFFFGHHNDFETLMKSFLDQSGLLLLSAIITLIIGLLLVVSHNIWERSWRLIITLMSWLIFISGLFRLFFIDYIVKSGDLWLHHQSLFLLFTGILFIIGLFLIYKGFWGAKDIQR